MDRLTTNPARVAAIADTLRSTSHDMDETLRTLADACLTLRAQWNGAARDAFEKAESAFATSMDARKELLVDIGTALDGVAQAYSDTDLAGQRALGSA